MLHRIKQTVPVEELINKASQSYLMSFTDQRGEDLRVCALCLEETWAASKDAEVNWDRRKMALWRSEFSG